jgi:hypothetical protein
MIHALRNWWPGKYKGPWVRPWGLSAPILVLIAALPILRPLRFAETPDNEALRLATIQSIVERNTLAIDSSIFAQIKGNITLPDTHQPGRRNTYSPQPPMLAVLLAGPYWVMQRFGLSLATDPAVTSYILTLLGATLPVAASAGLIYRMGRIFELTRPWRTLLAMSGVFGGGLFSYATVLNSHAPSAALLLASIACLVQASTAGRVAQGFGWIALGALASSSAAVIDLSAAVFLGLFALVPLAFRWPAYSRIMGLLVYALAAQPPLFAHAMICSQVTGEFRFAFVQIRPAPLPVDLNEEDADAEESTGLTQAAGRLFTGLVGARGIFSHFPILAVALLGTGKIMHRHWPGHIKLLGFTVVLGAMGTAASYGFLEVDWEQPMYSVRWFIPFLPLLMLWGGAWLRTSHHPAVWSIAGALLVLSILANVLGALVPFPRANPNQHTGYAAARALFSRPISP